MTTWLALIGLVAILVIAWRLYRLVGGLAGRGGTRPRRGGLGGRPRGGGTHQDEGDGDRPRRPQRPRRGGF